MRRRQFIALFGGAAATWPLTARAQREPLRRVAILMGTTRDAPGSQERSTAFLEAPFFHGRCPRAQQAGPVRLVGVLINFAESDPSAGPLLAAFRSALSKLGWTEGGNLRIDVRWGAGNPNSIRTLAKDCLC